MVIININIKGNLYTKNSKCPQTLLFIYLFFSHIISKSAYHTLGHLFEFYGYNNSKRCYENMIEFWCTIENTLHAILSPNISIYVCNFVC